VPVDLEDLTVLPGRQPELPARIDVEPARQIPHLDRPAELALRAVDDEPVLFAVAEIDVAVGRIDRNGVNHAEVALARVIAEPLVDELPVPVEMEHARGADAIRRRLVS